MKPNYYKGTNEYIEFIFKVVGFLLIVSALVAVVLWFFGYTENDVKAFFESRVKVG